MINEQKQKFQWTKPLWWSLWVCWSLWQTWSLSLWIKYHHLTSDAPKPPSSSLNSRRQWVVFSLPACTEVTTELSKMAKAPVTEDFLKSLIKGILGYLPEHTGGLGKKVSHSSSLALLSLCSSFSISSAQLGTTLPHPLQDHLAVSWDIFNW